MSARFGTRAKVTGGALAAAAVAATLLIPVTAASASGADKVHACVVPSSGHIRVVSADEVCKKNESRLEWRREGGTNFQPGFGLALVGDELSVTGAPWGGLTNVPSGFADNDDDNGAALVEELRRALASGGVVVNGQALGAGSVAARALAGTYGFWGEESVVGAVTSEKIADGTIQERDIAATLLNRLRDLEAKVAELEARLAALEAE